MFEASDGDEDEKDENYSVRDGSREQVVSGRDNRGADHDDAQARGGEAGEARDEKTNGAADLADADKNRQLAGESELNEGGANLVRVEKFEAAGEEKYRGEENRYDPQGDFFCFGHFFSDIY